VFAREDSLPQCGVCRGACKVLAATSCSMPPVAVVGATTAVSTRQASHQGQSASVAAREEGGQVRFYAREARRSRCVGEGADKMPRHQIQPVTAYALSTIHCLPT